VQYHPEFKSAPLAAHPIFRGFVAAACAHREKRPAGERVPMASESHARA
jgi:CTP synthase